MRKCLVNFLIFIVSLLYFGPSKNFGQTSRAASDWRRVTVCSSISFLIPNSFKEQNSESIDSCIVVFGDAEMGLKLDYGLYNGPFREIDDLYRKVKKEAVKIDGQKAELVTYELNQSEGRYIAQIYVNLGGAKRSSLKLDTSLYMVFQVNNQSDIEQAKEIFKSIRFIGSTRKKRR